MSDKFELDQLFSAIENALKTSNKVEKLSSPINENSEMRSPKEWDSLSFVAVFLAVHEEFGIDPEDDDAIHFTKVTSVREFLNEIL